MRGLNRRAFIAGTAGAALAGAASPAKVFAQPAAAPKLAVRRAIGTMQPGDPTLASYIRAVERMKALPASDPRSWNRMAQIHVDFCPHGNWFFLPWHRAYLVAFERVCRQLSGDPNFALPYWDWTAQRQLPPAFAAATAGGRRNPLFNETRQMRPDASLRESAVGPNVISRIMAETSYENFGSTRPTGQNSTEARWLRAPGRATLLEAGPHNTTHTAVGGDMGDMISPRDPIFWLHHCNVDRLWAQWNAGGRRNVSDPLWATFQFNGMFLTPQGQGTAPWNVGVRDVLDHKAFGYTYPDLPGNDQADSQQAAAAAPAEARPPRILASEIPKGPARMNTVLSTRCKLRGPAASRASEASVGAQDDARKIREINDALRQDAPIEAGGSTPAPAGGDAGDRPAADDATAGLPDGRIFSVLENLRSPSGNATTVNVFVNHPDPTADTPESDPHFVGTFGLFGLQSHAAHEGMSVQLELTQARARLQQANRALGREFDIQLVPVEARGGDIALTPGRIDIIAL